MVAITEAKGGDMAYFWNKGGGGGVDTTVQREGVGLEMRGY